MIEIQKISNDYRRYYSTVHLDAPVSEARFMDSSRTRALARLRIDTIRDLVEHLPSRYLDMSKVVPLRDARVGTDCTVVGRIHEIVEKRPRPRLTITEISIFDGTGVLLGVWFAQPWIASKYVVGERVAFSGKILHEFGYKRMNSPFVEKLASEGQDSRTGRILPIHPSTEGLSTNWMRRLIAAALDDHQGYIDYLPTAIRIKRALLSRDCALRNIHFPKSMELQKDAHYRLAYDELFMLQLYLAMRKRSLMQGVVGASHLIDGSKLELLKKSIPFTLTDDQIRNVSEILNDMHSMTPMNRMLLGDVGTGKTIVAAHALAAAADSGSQAAMMAPTEVLAQQYGEKLGPLLDSVGVTWALLTGSTSAKDRKEILAGVKNGSVSVLFGTHAILEDRVVFDTLSLAIVDEQHRFGVNQRMGLRTKGKGVDLLVMTATPIPRTLALTIYGDLDCSYLRQRPAGRVGVATRVESKNRSGEAYEVVRKAVQQGRQAYIICPLVGLTRKQDEEKTKEISADLAAGKDVSNLKAAISHSELLKKKIFPEFNVGLLTGKMKPAEKALVMSQFKAGKIDILVSTTVVEVGVDVPNATVMIIEDAERFGLSQLHQLRGRVGRGEHPGELILFADARTENTKERMEALVKTSDGFELAEYDLRLRKEGDILGDRQHGLPALKLSSALANTHLIEQTRDDALELLHEDEDLLYPENSLLLAELKRNYHTVWNLN